jgi:hypothetical protein
MVILFVVLALAVVFIIAAVVIGREARRLDAVPPKAVFDMEEATEWVANHIPFEVSAVLSFADVRRILEWNLEFLRAKGLASGQRHLDGSVVVGPDEVAEYVMGKAHSEGVPWSADQVTAVLDAQFGYFDAIGAVGGEASPDDLDG